jgi:micrococcal nuclease
MGPDTSPFSPLEIEPPFTPEPVESVENVIEETPGESPAEPEYVEPPEATADVDKPIETEPVENHPTEDTQPDIVNAWIQAPEGFCENPANQATVNYVVDGDTVKLWNGKKVRYIGVDAPEIKGNDCFSQEAKDLLMELTPMSEPVCLLADSKSGDTDYYGRLLRYVFVRVNGEWVMQNTRLIRMGVALAYDKYLSGTSYAMQMTTSESDARNEALGGWGACNGWTP